MAFDTLHIHLDFDPDIVSKSFMDKKAGLEITLGLFSNLPALYETYTNYNLGLGLAIQSRGAEQDELDQRCKTLMEEAQRADIPLLLTKSDMDFDNRWYWIGDLEKLFVLAKQDRIDCLLSPYLYDEILQIIRG